MMLVIFIFPINVVVVLLLSSISLYPVMSYECLKQPIQIQVKKKKDFCCSNKHFQLALQLQDMCAI